MLPIQFSKAEFIQSAPSIRECPADTGAEVAFAGRSNAGKSSAINTLTENHKLARTSKTPGRTQLINMFALSETQRLVDLPGYGFAKVPQKMKLQWERNLTEYLKERQCLKGLVLMMDIRHPMQEFDTIMLNSAISNDMPVHILLTKADKLKKGPANSTVLAVRKHMKDSQVDDLVTVQMYSSLKATGVKELKKTLTVWLNKHDEEFLDDDLIEDDGPLDESLDDDSEAAPEE